MTVELVAFALFAILFAVCVVFDNREYLRDSHHHDD